MRHVDFSPLYRSTVGFDRLLTMLDSLAQPEQTQSYPPYNIERTGETTYRITMAVAGFEEAEISIEAREHALTVKGEKADEKGCRRRQNSCIAGLPSAPSNAVSSSLSMLK
jgi:molecular chaperone IbpA